MTLGRTLSLTVAMLPVLAWSQSGGTALLDISVQTKSGDKTLSYNTSNLIPIGELSKLPVRNADTGEQNLELHVLATSPVNAPGKNLLDVQIELVSLDEQSAPRLMGQVKVLTRLNESVATSDSKRNTSPVVFTLTPLEIQRP